MTHRILRTVLIVTVETALLLVLAASWGIPGAHLPAASTRNDDVPTFEDSIRICGASAAAGSRGHRGQEPVKPISARAVPGHDE